MLRALVREARTASGGALVLAAAIPFVSLHPDYQPSLTHGSVGIDLSDLGMAAAVAAALWTIRRNGARTLAAQPVLWALFAVFLTWLVVSIAWAAHYDPNYPLHSRVVSAFKYVEFALLAPVAAVVLRKPADRSALLLSVVAWSSFLTAIAALQFLGVLNEFQGRRASVSRRTSASTSSAPSPALLSRSPSPRSWSFVALASGGPAGSQAGSAWRSRLRSTQWVGSPSPPGRLRPSRPGAACSVYDVQLSWRRSSSPWVQLP
jgi:hypothetical protein